MWWWWCGVVVNPARYNRPGRANSCFRLRRLYLICLAHTTIHHLKPQLVMCGLCAPPRLHRQEVGVLQRPRRAPVAQQARHAGTRRGYPEGEATETAKSAKIQNLDHDSALADAQKHSVCPCRQRFCHSRGLLTVLGVEVGVHSCSRLTQRTTSAQVWLSCSGSECTPLYIHERHRKRPLSRSWVYEALTKLGLHSALTL